MKILKIRLIKLINKFTKMINLILLAPLQTHKEKIGYLLENMFRNNFKKTNRLINMDKILLKKILKHKI